MAQKRELFSSRWALILAALGMAVGTGNIWRFPRIIAKVGGGAFFIPWLLFLFLWSIPLLIIEFGMGRSTRRGCIGAVGTLIGERFAWLGGFVALCSTAIMFYYSVVTGWCFKYFFMAIGGGLGSITNADQGREYFMSFTGSWEPVFYHLLAIGICGFIVWRGVTSGIEKANKIIIPTLLIILLMAAWRALTLPGAERGIAFLFTPHWETLLDYRTWLEALTQSAWSVGAGWGLILTYSVYMKRRQDITLNSVVIGMGDYSASLLAALIIIPTAFALIPATLPGGVDMTQAAQFTETVKVIQAAPPYEQYNPASTGLTFVFIPALLNSIQAEFGSFFMIIFFLALTMAAVSSLIASVELTSRVLMDAGLTRSKAIAIVATVGFVFGIPSALSMDFFQNQDWVWGIGLMVNGFFLTMTAVRFGIDRFRRELVNTSPGIKVGRWFNLLIAVILPLEFLVLIVWWFSQTWGSDWWNPFAISNPGTCFFQWGIAIIFLLAINRFMARRSVGSPLIGGGETEV